MLINVNGLHSLSPDEFIDILAIYEGKEAFRQAIKRAFSIGIFEDIEIKCDTDDCLEVNVNVKEKPIIKKIKFFGNHHFSQSELSKQLAVETKQRLNAFKLRQSISNLKHYLALRGFDNASVQAQVNYLNPPSPTSLDYVQIDIFITEGKPKLIQNVVVNDPFALIYERIPFDKGSVLDLIQMQELKHKLNDYLKKHKIAGRELDFVIDNATVYVDLSGAFYLDITFTGNSYLSKDTLLNELPFFKDASTLEDTIYEAKEKMRQLYVKNGFLDVQIVPVLFRGSDNLTYELNFYIDEGNQYNISNITLVGNTLPTDKLLDFVGIKEGDIYDKAYIQHSPVIMKELYSSLGYLNADIALKEEILPEQKLKLTYLIKEGMKYVIQDIVIEGNSAITTPEILKQIPIKISAPHNDFDISMSRRKILELYEQIGFVNATVKVQTSFTDNLSTVRFDILEGTQSFFGKTLIAGNVDVKPEVIKRQLKNTEGEPFNISTVLKDRQNLYRLGLFDEVEYSILTNEHTNTKDVLYTLTEGKHGAVELSIGYGEYERLRASAEISHKNISGLNRLASLRTELSSIEQRLIGTFVEPYFLNAKTSLKSSLLLEHRKERTIDHKSIRYTIDKISANIGIDKQLSDALKCEVYYEASVVNTYNIKPDIVLSREDTGTLLISAIRGSLIYDKRDNVFEPKSGFLTGIGAKYASKYLMSETDFYKVSMYFNNYQSLARRVVLGLSFKSGFAKGLDETKELPIVERFFLGGRNSVRGFAQDDLGPKGALTNTPTGGNAFISVSTELRGSVYKGFGLVVFVDGGNVWQKTNNVDISNLRYTAGAGLRYNTPVGPFRLDYGFKLHPLRGESKGELHFTLGHAF